MLAAGEIGVSRVLGSASRKMMDDEVIGEDVGLSAG